MLWSERAGISSGTKICCTNIWDEWDENMWKTDTRDGTGHNAL